MIIRPPEKKTFSKTKPLLSFFPRVANDNQPPQKIVLGWVLFTVGAFILAGAFLLL